MTRFLAWLDAPGSGLPILAALLIVVLITEVWSRRAHELAQRRALRDARTDKLEDDFLTPLRELAEMSRCRREGCEHPHVPEMTDTGFAWCQRCGTLLTVGKPMWPDPPPVSDAMRVRQVLHDAGLHREVEDGRDASS